MWHFSSSLYPCNALVTHGEAPTACTTQGHNYLSDFEKLNNPDHQWLFICSGHYIGWFTGTSSTLHQGSFGWPYFMSFKALLLQLSGPPTSTDGPADNSGVLGSPAFIALQ